MKNFLKIAAVFGGVCALVIAAAIFTSRKSEASYISGPVPNGTLNIGGVSGNVQSNQSGVLYGDSGLNYVTGSQELQIGSSNPNSYPNAPIVETGNVNNYYQHVIQNLSPANNASAEFIAGGNQMTDLKYFAEFGCNSSGYNQSAFSSQPAQSCFMSSSDSDLVIGTGSTTGGNASSTVKITAGGNQSNNVVAVFQPNGDVGINNTAPANILEVGGFVNVDQYSGYKQNNNLILTASSTGQTTLVGVGAGSALIYNGATGNTLIGFNSGHISTTTALTTCTGYNTCSSIISTGNQNIDMYGANSGNAVTTGSNLDGFGNNTLNKATTASSMVALGTQGCSSITTGSGDVCIGIQAEEFDATGISNVFIGNSAGFNNISATSTTCGGYNSCYGNAGGRYNAQGNAGWGYETLFNLATSSDYNTTLGYRAGMNITGQGNIDIGAASSTSDFLTTGYNNIKIGNNISFPGNNATTSLDIGNLIYGNGLTSTGATVNTAGLVGIATGTPSGTLAIAGFAGTLPFYISTTTATVASSTLFEVDGQGNLHLGGGTPVLSSCGTSPSLDADATDQSGTITVGSVSATTCTLTFSAVKPAVPHCNVTSQTGTIAITYTESASALVITNAALTGDKVDYNCSLGH